MNPDYQPVWANHFQCYMVMEGDIPHEVYRYLEGYTFLGDGWKGYAKLERAHKDLQLAMEKAK